MVSAFSTDLDCRRKQEQDCLARAKAKGHAAAQRSGVGAAGGRAGTRGDGSQVEHVADAPVRAGCRAEGSGEAPTGALH